jgi:hypothetical protein
MFWWKLALMARKFFLVRAQWACVSVWEMLTGCPVKPSEHGRGGGWVCLSAHVGVSAYLFTCFAIVYPWTGCRRTHVQLKPVVPSLVRACNLSTCALGHAHRTLAPPFCPPTSLMYSPHALLLSALPPSPLPLFGTPYSLSVGVIFISYALQVKFQPYASSGVTNDLDSMDFTSNLRLVYTYKLNSLESMYLVTSMFILLSGMAFQSQVAVKGSLPYVALTYIVMIVLVASVSERVALLCEHTTHACSLPPALGTHFTVVFP